MIKDILKLGWLFAVLVFGQILVLNRIQFSGFINPYLYVLFVLFLPVGTNRGLLMLLSFFTGLIIDIFSNTPGMHAGACVLIGFLRPFIIKSLSLRDTFNSDSCPSLTEFGWVWYLKYASILVLCHHTFLFFIEQFDHLFIWATLLRIVLSSLATLIFIVVAQFFLPVKIERR